MTSRALALLVCCISLTAQEKGRLTLGPVQYQAYAGGPALRAGHEFRAGETAFFRCRLNGFKVSDKDLVSVKWNIRALDPAGQATGKVERGEALVEIEPQDKEWTPWIEGSYEVPGLTRGGEYRWVIEAQDEIAGAKAQFEIPLKVRVLELPPVEGITVHRFEFQAEGGEGPALREAVYARGAAVFARFQMIGFTVGDGYQVQVEYGLEVLRPSGKSLYVEQVAAAENKKFDHAPAYLPGQLSLTTTPNLPAGTYTLILRLHDKLSGKSSESKHSFELR
jgi:hypothetical protein